MHPLKRLLEGLSKSDQCIGFVILCWLETALGVRQLHLASPGEQVAPCGPGTLPSVSSHLQAHRPQGGLQHELGAHHELVDCE